MLGDSHHALMPMTLVCWKCCGFLGHEGVTNHVRNQSYPVCKAHGLTCSCTKMSACSDFLVVCVGLC